MTDFAAPITAPAAPREVALPWWKKGPSFGKVVKAEDVMNFSRQAASFMSAGVPILDALGIVAEECGSKRMVLVLNDLQRRLRGGSSFGDAIARHTDVFPGYFIAVVRAAELTGKLDEAFEQLADDMQRDIAAKRQIKSALTYPCIVMALAVVAVIVMATWVLPKFKGFYASLGAKLPLPTRMLLGFTDFMGKWWWLIVTVLVVIVVAGGIVFGGPSGKRRRDPLLLKLPALGNVLRIAALERFCRVLSALVHAGVPLPDAVRVSADSTNQSVFQDKLATVREAMMRGEGLARPIAASGIFPAAARQMIRVGESTGSLDEQLANASRFYARELEYRLKRLTDSFEPAIVIFVGLIVGFVALAQISAMYSVYSQVHT
jgi:type IV pilus assembly protein PilC